MTSQLISPHGGELVNLLAAASRAEELREASREWPSWTLTPRQMCDLELLLVGGFSPLRGFMERADYEPVCAEMRLADRTLWPIPVVLDVTEEVAKGLSAGDRLALRDPEGVMLAALTVGDVWEPDREAEAESVYGSKNEGHAGVAHLFRRTHPFYVGGRLEGVQTPWHFDFRPLRQTPTDLRREFERLGWKRIVAFQTRNPMHRAHVAITMAAARETKANLLIHPTVGSTQPGDLDHYTRVRAYQAIMDRYPRYTARLALLPLAMRMAGPREALWHAIIRKNYGCTHFIVGRHHASPGNVDGRPVYGAYAAQTLFTEKQDELGIEMVPFREMVYVEDYDRYEPRDEVPPDVRTLSISGTELRERLSDGREIPTWFTFPEVARELRRTHPPRYRQGFTVFFTGLSGAGKSTIARALLVKLLEMGGRPVTLLDGDVVRLNLSSELGFSKEHRDLNIRRIGFVASEITKNGGIAICAPIAPYDQIRHDVREHIEPLGGFVLVHVATPLSVCEQRDRKGLYAKARAGLIQEFTGISDPYEEPTDAEVVIDTTRSSPEEAANEVILTLEQLGYIGGLLKNGRPNGP